MVGASAVDLGFPPPSGTGDNILAIENQKLLVSDYGPLTSSLTVAFVRFDAVARSVTLASVKDFSVDVASLSEVTAWFHRADGSLLGSTTISSAAMVGLTSQEPINFVVFTFSEAEGSGLERILFDGARLGVEPITITPPPQPIVPAPTRGNVLGAEKTAPGILVGPVASDPPEVRLFTGHGEQVARFNAYEEHFRGGVQVGMGDVDGDGTGEIVTAPGPGTPPQIRIFDRNAASLQVFCL